MQSSKLITRSACLTSFLSPLIFVVPAIPRNTCDASLLLFCWLTADGEALNRTLHIYVQHMTQKLDISTYWIASYVPVVGWRRMYGGWCDCLSVCLLATVVCLTAERANSIEASGVIQISTDGRAAWWTCIHRGQHTDRHRRCFSTAWNPRHNHSPGIIPSDELPPEKCPSDTKVILGRSYVK